MNQDPFPLVAVILAVGIAVAICGPAVLAAFLFVFSIFCQ
jgi:hypothetical protein